MATTNIRTLAQLREDIKIEARVKGSDNLDAWINSLIHELLTTALQNKRYLEMLVLNEEITTVEDTASYDLPEDFMAIARVQYRPITGSARSLHDRNHYVQIPRGRNPRYYDIVGENALVLSPIDDMPSDDTIVIDYYRYPEEMDDAAPFPVPKLIAPVKQKAVARAMIYNRERAEALVLQAEGVLNEARGHQTQDG